MPNNAESGSNRIASQLDAFNAIIIHLVAELLAAKENPRESASEIEEMLHRDLRPIKDGVLSDEEAGPGADAVRWQVSQIIATALSRVEG